MKSKTKTQSKRGKAKDGTYSAVYLGLVLGVMLLLEGFMMGVATPENWSDSMSVLDVSGGFNQLVSDFGSAVEPMMDQVAYVNEFFQLAANEITPMMDWSESDVLVFPRGVIEFYDLASVEMSYLLDFSDQFENVPKVAGLAIFR